MNGRCLLLLRQEVRNIDFIALLCIQAELGLPDMKFVLLHEGKNDDGIKSFFMDVWELYVKVSFRFEYNKYMRENWPPSQTMMNPFHTAHSPIKSNVFDTRVRQSAKKYLG